MPGAQSAAAKSAVTLAAGDRRVVTGYSGPTRCGPNHAKPRQKPRAPTPAPAGFNAGP